jgi:hypothetical protein
MIARLPDHFGGRFSVNAHFAPAACIPGKTITHGEIARASGRQATLRINAGKAGWQQPPVRNISIRSCAIACTIDHFCFAEKEKIPKSAP